MQTQADYSLVVFLFSAMALTIEQGNGFLVLSWSGTECSVCRYLKYYGTFNVIILKSKGSSGCFARVG